MVKLRHDKLVIQLWPFAFQTLASIMLLEKSFSLQISTWCFCPPFWLRPFIIGKLSVIVWLFLMHLRNQHDPCCRNHLFLHSLSNTILRLFMLHVKVQWDSRFCILCGRRLQLSAFFFLVCSLLDPFHCRCKPAFIGNLGQWTADFCATSALHCSNPQTKSLLFNYMYPLGIGVCCIC